MASLKKPFDVELVRDVIPIVSVKSITVKPGYGYLRISNFTATTTLRGATARRIR